MALSGAQKSKLICEQYSKEVILSACLQAIVTFASSREERKSNIADYWAALALVETILDLNGLYIHSVIEHDNEKA